MRGRRITVVVSLLGSLAGAAVAQDYSGSYAAPLPQGGQMALVLRQDARGRVTGTLSGNAQFQIQAQVRNGQIAGYATAPGGRLYLEAQLQAEGLMLALAEVGPDGQPQAETARTMMLTRTGGQGLGMAQPPQPTGGRPAQPGRQTRRGAAAADPYVGTFVNGPIAVTLSRQGQGYGGVATFQGVQAPLQAQAMGDRISGSYQVQGMALPFEAQVQGDVMVIATNDGTFQLQRSEGGVAGGTAAPGAAGAAGGAAGGVAATPQDRQLAQLLTGSPWCYFSYNQTSGASRTERVVFRPDGTGGQGTNAESYSSGNAGVVAGQSQGGGQFRWRLQSGVLLVTQDGVQWEQIPLRVTQNSNGSPIVNAGTKEYARCN